MEKTCGNCIALMRDKGKPYYCDGHELDYHKESDMACGDWRYGEAEADVMETETAYPQDKEENEYRYISPAWLNEIAKGLTKGAEKHPGETWRTIPTNEHLYRAMRHINLYLMGNRSEPHLINASMRLMMAFDTSRNEAGE